MLIMKFTYWIYILNMYMFHYLSMSKQECCEAKTGCAFVWLVMIGNSYVPGALVSAHSFKRVGSVHDLVVMVTDDIKEDERKQLGVVFDAVVGVKYLEFKSASLKTEKQVKTYSWIDKSYTKWNCLNLTQYNKVCIVDADLVALRNIDDVFELNVPAGIFASPYNKIYSPYGRPKHGSLVSASKVWKGLTLNSFVPNAYLMVLPTSEEYYKGLIDMILECSNESGYGFSTCYYGYDEQSISHFLSCYAKGPKLNWSAMDPKYGFNVGKYNMLLRGEAPLTLHYLSHPKPWVSKENWPDLDVWWALARDLKAVENGLCWDRLNIDNVVLGRKDAKTCYYCKMFYPRLSYKHSFMSCVGLKKYKKLNYVL